FGIVFGILWLIFGMISATPIAAAAVGVCAAVVGFLYASVSLMLIAPVSMMENLRGLKAVKRSRNLVSRSLVTALSAYIIMFLIPVFAAGTLSFVVGMTAKAMEIRRPSIQERRAEPTVSATTSAEPDPETGERTTSYNINLGNGRRVSSDDASKPMRVKVIDTFLDTLLQILLLPIQIVVISFTAIIVALLYLKTRQAGGESLHDLLSQFEESDKPRKKWQERVRQRLIKSGRITSRS
ncbi:MAG: hypothetical protein AAB288_08275, partial [Acidobacteriota bacterium]